MAPSCLRTATTVNTRRENRWSHSSKPVIPNHFTISFNEKNMMERFSLYIVSRCPCLFSSYISSEESYALVGIPSA